MDEIEELEVSRTINEPKSRCELAAEPGQKKTSSKEDQVPEADPEPKEDTGFVPFGGKGHSLK